MNRTAENYAYANLQTGAACLPQRRALRFNTHARNSR